MSGFEGSWMLTNYSIVTGQQVIPHVPSINPSYITVTKLDPDLYRIVVPLTGDNPFWVFEVPLDPSGRSFSHTQEIGGKHLGVKILFNDSENPTAIVEGPQGTQIERWPHGVAPKEYQPDDMGTFTGNKP